MVLNAASGEKGSPQLYNRLLPLARVVSQLDIGSVYFPGQTPDDKLSLELAYTIQMLNSKFSTRLPSLDDYDANIKYLEELVTTTKVLHCQLNALITKLKDDKAELVSEKKKKI